MRGRMGDNHVKGDGRKEGEGRRRKEGLPLRYLSR